MRFVAILLTIASTISVVAAAEDNAPGYRLAPGDRLKVTVHSQAELSGDAPIDSAGEIHLPLLDAVHVGQMTVDEARDAIVEHLRQGLIKNPSVSVSVKEFRPIFVLGDVRAPGSYPFRFGLSGLSAVALAGGIGRPDLSPAGALADLMSAEEHVRILTRKRVGLLVHLARLTAERNNRKAFDFTYKDGNIDAEELSALISEEREQLRVVLEARNSTIALIDRQRPRVKQEIATTKKQIEVEASQLELIRASVNQYNGLIKRGLGRTVTELDFQRQATDREGIISRLKGDLSRFETSLGDLDLRAQDVENARKARIAAELRDAKQKLSELDVQLPSARQLLELRQLQTGETPEGEGLAATHRLILTRAGVRQKLALAKGEDIPLEPGDIVEVARIKSDKEQASADEAAPSFSSQHKTKAASLGVESNTSAGH